MMFQLEVRVARLRAQPMFARTASYSLVFEHLPSPGDRLLIKVICVARVQLLAFI